MKTLLFLATLVIAAAMASTTTATAQEDSARKGVFDSSRKSEYGSGSGRVVCFQPDSGAKICGHSSNTPFTLSTGDIRRRLDEARVGAIDQKMVCFGSEFTRCLDWSELGVDDELRHLEDASEFEHFDCVEQSWGMRCEDAEDRQLLADKAAVN
ncbi:hypothetical protein BBJ28_00016065 [Nothophytophthora sp. Chile5]|nr:hypothetical protein BBJ28_00016065 [Nothophytophthora sp. Chile5]